MAAGCAVRQAYALGQMPSTHSRTRMVERPGATARMYKAAHLRTVRDSESESRIELFPNVPSI